MSASAARLREIRRELRDGLADRAKEPKGALPALNRLRKTHPELSRAQAGRLVREIYKARRTADRIQNNPNRPVPARDLPRDPAAPGGGGGRGGIRYRVRIGIPDPNATDPVTGEPGMRWVTDTILSPHALSLDDLLNQLIPGLEHLLSDSPRTADLALEIDPATVRVEIVSATRL